MTKTKRFLALFLALALVLTMIPATAAASEETTWTLVTSDIPEGVIIPTDTGVSSKVYKVEPDADTYYEIFGNYSITDSGNWFAVANTYVLEDESCSYLAGSSSEYNTDTNKYQIVPELKDDSNVKSPLLFEAGRTYYVVIESKGMTLNEVNSDQLDVKNIRFAEASGGRVYNVDAYGHWKAFPNEVSKPSTLSELTIWEGEVTARAFVTVETNEGYTFTGLAVGNDTDGYTMVTYGIDDKTDYAHAYINFGTVKDGDTITPIFRYDGGSGDSGNTGDNPGFQPDETDLYGMKDVDFLGYGNIADIPWDVVYGGFGDVGIGQTIYPFVADADKKPVPLTGDDVTFTFEPALAEGDNAQFDAAKDENGYWTIVCDTDDVEIYNCKVTKGGKTYGPMEIGVNVWLEDENGDGINDVTRADLINEAVNAETKNAITLGEIFDCWKKFYTYKNESDKEQVLDLKVKDLSFHNSKVYCTNGTWLKVFESQNQMLVPAGETVYFFCHTFTGGNVDNTNATVKLLLTTEAVENQKLIDAAAKNPNQETIALNKVFDCKETTYSYTNNTGSSQDLCLTYDMLDVNGGIYIIRKTVQGSTIERFSLNTDIVTLAAGETIQLYTDWGGAEDSDAAEQTAKLILMDVKETLPQTVTMQDAEYFTYKFTVPKNGYYNYSGILAEGTEDFHPQGHTYTVYDGNKLGIDCRMQTIDIGEEGVGEAFMIFADGEGGDNFMGQPKLLEEDTAYYTIFEVNGASVNNLKLEELKVTEAKVNQAAGGKLYNDEAYNAYVFEGQDKPQPMTATKIWKYFANFAVEIEDGYEMTDLLAGKTSVFVEVFEGEGAKYAFADLRKAGEITEFTPVFTKKVTGGGGGYVPVTPPSDNVTNESGTAGTGASTNADMSQSTTMKGNETTTTVNQTVADKIVEKAVENKSEEVVIDATYHEESAAHSTKSAEVALPTETLQQIAEKTEADVTIKTDVAEIKLDNAAAAAVAQQAEGATVSVVAEKVNEDAREVRVELKIVCSEGKTISNFDGGSISVTVPAPKGKKDVVCVYIDEQGHMHKVPGQLNEDGTYTFTTGHFSTYAIMDEADADAAIAAQKEAVKKIKFKLKSKLVKAKNGKKAVKLTWDTRSDLEFDGVAVYRSTRKNSGYGKKPFFTTTKDSYTNTAVKNGTRYYYKVRGYVYIDGEKVYTDYSTKAWRTVK